jgi:enoyl-CoA hydratase/carnithine racemase
MPPTAEPSGPLLDICGPVARIRLHRPEAHNRIDPADLAPLLAQMDQVEADPQVRVLILTGSGTRTFSSGYTISALSGLAASAVPFESVIDRLEALALPTVAALNGNVYGGATDLALACDLRVGVAGMRLVMPAARIGLHYYPGGLRRFVERLGLSAAKQLFLLGEPVEDEQLLRWGYLTHRVAPEALESCTEALALQLATGAPQALRGMKRHLNALARGQADPALMEADYLASLRSADLEEGIEAFAQKRAARFTGR